MKTVRAKFTICNSEGHILGKIYKMFFGDKVYEDINSFKENIQMQNSEGIVLAVTFENI